MADNNIQSIANNLEAVIANAVQQALAQQQGQNTQINTNNVNQGTQSATKSVNTTPQQQQTVPGATPTDVGQFNAPLAKIGNMQTGEYTNPYQAEQQALVQQLGTNKLYETPPETQNFLKGLFKSQTEKFNYVAENDPLVKLSKQNVTNLITDMATKRGFAFNSGTQDIINQQMAKVTPQLENIARGEHEQFLSRQLNLANTIMKWEQIQFDRSQDQIKLITTKLEFLRDLDARSFNEFKTMLDQRNWERNYYLETQKFDLDKKLNEQLMALERIENLGYVDTQASTITGVPVGTPAKWAKQLSLEHAHNLQKLQKQFEYNLAKQKLDAQLEKELYALRSRLDTEAQLKLQAQAFQYKKTLQAMEYQKDLAIMEIDKQKDIELAGMEYQKDITIEGMDLQKSLDLANIEYQKDVKLTEIEYAKDVELKKIEEAKAAAEAAVKAAKGGSGRKSSGGGGSSSSYNASIKAETGKTQSQLDAEFNRIKADIHQKVVNSWTTPEMSAYLESLIRNGATPAVIAAIRDFYDIPVTQGGYQARAPG